ncbi:MAG: hypothetical protein O3B42_08145 [Actinomycetota bacterium]|nr:hypothetical protein [Actinomycetota bacterium]
MLEIATAAVFVVAAVATVGGKHAPITAASTNARASAVGDGSDLPCPWCRSQTADGDVHCPSCGHRFG